MSKYEIDQETGEVLLNHSVISSEDVVDRLNDLEAKLAESEEYNKMLLEEKSGYIDLVSGYSKKCKKYEQQLAEKDKNNLILYSMLYETLEKQGCENIASQIDQMTGFTLDKQAEWFKGNRNYDELLKLLAEKEKEIDKLEDKLHHYYEETLNKGTCGLCEHLRGEYKTDFAIEKLEKVKDWIDKEVDVEYTRYIQIIDYIDNQIKQLKEWR